MSEERYVRVEVSLACGCQSVLGVEVPEGDDCSPAFVMAVLEAALFNDTTFDLLTEDSHTERGHEHIDIKVRMKLGPVPDEGEEFDV